MISSLATLFVLRLSSSIPHVIDRPKTLPHFGISAGDSTLKESFYVINMKLDLQDRPKKYPRPAPGLKEF